LKLQQPIRTISPDLLQHILQPGLLAQYLTHAAAVYRMKRLPCRPDLGCCLVLLHVLQILRRLLIFGFSSDAKTLQAVPAVASTAPQLLAAVSALQAARPPQQQQGNGSGGGALVRGQLLAMLDRGMLKLIKTLSQVQQEHPW
jgi:hypothetical protein